MSTPLPDSELVRRARTGDCAAYLDLVRRYEKTARIVALRALQNHHSAEDAVQDAFLIGLTKLATLRNDDSFGPWILRIVQREAARASHAMHKSISLADATQIESKETQLDDAMQFLVELLQKLPEHERIVVTMHYLDGYSTKEIAAFLTRPIGTVTKQLSRAMDRLQKSIQHTETTNEF